MNKRQKALALKYDDHEDVAPKVVAKGHGLVAEEILERASEHEVPVYEDETLINLLDELNINETIPEDLYEIVAEVFAFIYQTDKKYD
ncbi:EscU/YscU/HrcU family type III secretion system export apparatus switch protein [Piscibacillus salipiscarius]|uniref:EscU/YscU/HrcU family type III secretion system export apparatus switch protein n=1 Tax=Piscibacillus salipiscarius TaxID=299480 RepID=A0ABW5Q8F7_9BACI|nr:EscU/YscU/HrcU family type III secretion system export apparatus switch protein [Piscibacillus salipiscarius]